MIAVRYLILAIVSFVLTALVLAVVYLPVVVAAAFALSRSLHPTYLLMYAGTAGMSVLPGLIVFSLVAPALLLTRIHERLSWHATAPLCFLVSPIYWSITARSAVGPGPSAGMGEAIFTIVSLVAVLAVAIGGPRLVKWITAVSARLMPA